MTKSVQKNKQSIKSILGQFNFLSQDKFIPKSEKDLENFMLRVGIQKAITEVAKNSFFKKIHDNYVFLS